MIDKPPRLTLPDLDWKTTTCVVCGQPFDYLGKRRPRTCKNGRCRYIHHYRIAPETWANHQLSLFDRSNRS